MATVDSSNVGTDIAVHVQAAPQQPDPVTTGSLIGTNRQLPTDAPETMVAGVNVVLQPTRNGPTAATGPTPYAERVRWSLH